MLWSWVQKGCSATGFTTVEVGAGATAEAGLDQHICEGASAVLTASGGVSYQWNTGETSQSILVTPTVTTTYSVTVVDGAGCTGTDEVTVFLDGAIANAGPDQMICGDEEVILTASGGVSYQWNTGETTSTIVVSPDESTTYTVTVVNASGCTDTDEVSVTVGNGNEDADAGFDQMICGGETATLTASGGVSYMWNNGATTATIAVSPSVTTTYSVMVANAEGCIGTDEATVFVSAGMDVEHTRICDDAEVTGEYQVLLTITNGEPPYMVTGDFNGELGEGETVSFSVIDGEGYFLSIVSGSGCVTVIDESDLQPCLKDFADAGEDKYLCEGDAAELDAVGGVSYEWSNGATTPSIVVSPEETTVYTVIVTDAVGDTDTDQVTVFVSPAFDLDESRDLQWGIKYG